MNEELSRSCLAKIADRWNKLTENEKDKFKKQYDESKKELKKNVKEFIMVNKFIFWVVEFCNY